MRTEQVLDIAINLGLIAGLVGTHRGLANEFDHDDSRWGTANTLYWCAMVGGVAVVGDGSGHLALAFGRLDDNLGQR